MRLIVKGSKGYQSERPIDNDGDLDDKGFLGHLRVIQYVNMITVIICVATLSLGKDSCVVYFTFSVPQVYYAKLSR